VQLCQEREVPGRVLREALWLSIRYHHMIVGIPLGKHLPNVNSSGITFGSDKMPLVDPLQITDISLLSTQKNLPGLSCRYISLSLVGFTK